MATLSNTMKSFRTAALMGVALATATPSATVLAEPSPTTATATLAPGCYPAAQVRAQLVAEGMQPVVVGNRVTTRADRPANYFTSNARGEGYEITCHGADCRAPDVLENEWVGTGGPCSGDSGGPAFDVDGRIIGVVSRGQAGCTEPVFSDISSRAAWLSAEIAAVTEPEPEPEPKDDGPAESCALSRAPRFGVSPWLFVVGLGLGLLRRSRQR